MVEAAPTTHATHDPLLVAALVDRDLAGPELDRARAQVADCSACAELHADLLSLAAATRALPTPARPRDFTLTETDVARLRPGLVRRLLGAIGSSRDAFSRPLAAGLTTLGLAGLLVATVPTVLPAGESGAAALSPVGAPITPELDTTLEGPVASDSLAGEPAIAAGEDQFQRADEGDMALRPGPQPPAALVALSLAFLVVGLGLGALRLAAGRRAREP